MKGRIALLFAGSSVDMAVVLGSERDNGSWNAVIIASNNERYPVGGHNIVVTSDDLKSSMLVSVESLEDFFGMRDTTVVLRATLE